MTSDKEENSLLFLFFILWPQFHLWPPFHLLLLVFIARLTDCTFAILFQIKMTPTIPTLFTESKPKRADITGSIDQAFSSDGSYMSYLLGAIGAGTIAAIGSVSPVSNTLQFLFAPQVHTDLGGTPIAIVGNASNTFGEFSCVKIDITSFQLFPIISAKDSVSALPHGAAPFPADILIGTDWADFPEDLHGALVPNFFFIYFGQLVPCGDIRDDDVKVQMLRLGQGYELWAKAVNRATKDAVENDEVLAKAADKPNYNKVAFFQAHFLATWADRAPSLPIGLIYGPWGIMTSVPSSEYPTAAAVLKSIFTPPPPAPALPPHQQALTAPGTLTLQLPAEVEKEVEAKKGTTKLMLLHICGKFNEQSWSVDDISQAMPSTGMQVVMTNPRAARAQALSDLLRQTIHVTKNHDTLNIRSRLISISHVSKALAGHMLQGNFALEGATSLANEANSVDPSAFLPQRNQCLINQEKNKDLTSKTESSHDVLDSHKTKTSTAISRIGTMADMSDFTALCINMDTIITAVVANNGPHPSLLRQMLHKFISVVNCTDWDEWYTSTGNSMPCLHWHCYTFLEKIFNHFADFATNFGNVNVVMEGRPLTDLDTTAITKAVKVMKAFVDQIDQHQSLFSPITILASVVTKYTTSPYNNTNVCPPAMPAVPNGTPTRADSGASKRDPSTPNDARVAASQRQKKARRGVSGEGPKRNVTDMGMFHLYKPDAKASEVFPNNLPERVCVDFTCKGRECKNANCSFAHPRKVTDLNKDTVLAICRHFAAKKIGWLNEWHFLKHVEDLPAEFRALMGGKEGPGTSKNRMQ